MLIDETGSGFAVFPLTPNRWEDLTNLFGERGACGGCWCMWWRLRQSQFNNQKGQLNREALEALVESGETPGLIAYAENRPIGWCAIAPREEYVVLANSRILQKVDDQSVWSVVCFFIAKPYRRKGVTVELLKAAVKYARENGASIVEGYPVEPKKASMPDTFAYTGLAAAFLKAGFSEVARRSETRPIMRYYIGS